MRSRRCSLTVAEALSSCGAITPSRRLSEAGGGLGGQPHSHPPHANTAAHHEPTPTTASMRNPSDSFASPASLPGPPSVSEPTPTRTESLTADVLIVDDDRFCLMATAAAIRRLGFSVKTAEDGDEAVDLIVTRGQSFRLVLLDKNMARMDGPEAVRQISTHFARGRPIEGSESPQDQSEIQTLTQRQCVPSVVGLTGDTLEDACEAFLRSGAEKVMLKPLKVEDLKLLLASK
uniref:Response regulatory domain-containing protein n=1 Tax=Chromera velia CCMP2878 TaxID=1169474 RepID=A0A0G4I3Y0_9ALVE|eukprot:Cvel_10737.t1-p1 / transcript=Cvel_10737.t1 / gene=Cvel_10737 / organism=Chromera_velia_CCMP2878 / gene_product=Autoinducer 2 sensor kinase/phosphatase LuxQ, putative / transcript_product=Autoinducer 2 sensor kinase/phosphatase LuxQ, putative / location=Cvel_scaffold654:57868-58563(+) / protein_length=232 / sequence_SO=supercontig / SO=protein_coding / is_pseudo=false